MRVVDGVFVVFFANFSVVVFVVADVVSFSLLNGPISFFINCDKTASYKDINTNIVLLGLINNFLSE